MVVDPEQRRDAAPWHLGVPPGPVEHRAVVRMRWALLGAVVVLALVVTVAALVVAAV